MYILFYFVQCPEKTAKTEEKLQTDELCIIIIITVHIHYPCFKLTDKKSNMKILILSIYFLV